MFASVKNNHQLPFEYQTFEYSGITNPHLLREIVRLRQAVWANTELHRLIGDDIASWLDDHEADSEHCLVRFGEELVGYGRLTLFPSFSNVPYEKFAAARSFDPPGPQMLVGANCFIDVTLVCYSDEVVSCFKQ